MSRPDYKEPDFFAIHGSEHPLSGVAMLELLRATLVKGKPFRFRALGFSMSPMIKNGDVITVAPIQQRIRLGEVVAFVHPANGQLIVHRIIRFQGKDYWSQGDNLPGTMDGLSCRENILGKVVKIERNQHSIRFGLGSERILIAIFSRRGWLSILIKKFYPLWSRWRRKAIG